MAFPFGFENKGQVGNDLKLAAVGTDLFTTFGAANATQASGKAALAIAKANQKILNTRASVTRKNEQYTLWAGKYKASQIQLEADLNLRLAEDQYQETLRSADVVQRATDRAYAAGMAKSAEYTTEAGAVDKTARVASLRAFQAGRQFLGSQRVATAQAGFVETGSELAMQLENANRLEDTRLEMVRNAAEESRKLRYGGEVARFEAETARWQGAEQVRDLTYTANLDMFKSKVNYWSAEQEAQVVLQDAKMSAWNLEQQALDYEAQGEVKLMEGKAAKEAADAKAKSDKTAAIIGTALKVASFFV